MTTGKEIQEKLKASVITVMKGTLSNGLHRSQLRFRSPRKIYY